MSTPNIIHRYTNEQAIKDGYKVPVHRPSLYGFDAPLFLTSSVFDILNKGDYGIRTIAMLAQVSEAIRTQRAQKPGERFFTATYAPSGEEHLLWCIRDGDGYTIMLPSDY